MSVDGMDLIRAAYKELHLGGEYAEGKGRDSRERPVAEEGIPLRTALWVPVYNSKGARQDAAFDGLLSLFNNWNINLDFLRGLVGHGKQDNKLELFLWRCHRCNDLRALARVNTLWKLVITDAMSRLSGKASELDDWSLVRVLPCRRMHRPRRRAVPVVSWRGYANVAPARAGGL